MTQARDPQSLLNSCVLLDWIPGVAGETLSSGDDAPRRLLPGRRGVAAIFAAAVVAVVVLVTRHAEADRRDQARLRLLDDVRVSVAQTGGGSEDGHVDMALAVTNNGGHPVTVSAVTVAMRGMSGSALAQPRHVPAGATVEIRLSALVDCAIIGASTQGELRLTLLSAAGKRHVLTERIVDPRTDPAMTSMTLILQACHAEDAGAALSTEFALIRVRGRDVVGRLTLGNDGRSPLKVLQISANDVRVAATLTPAPPFTIPARGSHVVLLRLHLESCTGGSFRDGFDLDVDGSNERGRGSGAFDDSSIDDALQRVSLRVCHHA